MVLSDDDDTLTVEDRTYKRIDEKRLQAIKDEITENKTKCDQFATKFEKDRDEINATVKSDIQRRNANAKHLKESIAGAKQIPYCSLPRKYTEPLSVASWLYN